MAICCAFLVELVTPIGAACLVPTVPSLWPCERARNGTTPRSPNRSNARTTDLMCDRRKIVDASFFTCFLLDVLRKCSSLRGGPRLRSVEKSPECLTGEVLASSWLRKSLVHYISDRHAAQVCKFLHLCALPQ